MVSGELIKHSVIKVVIIQTSLGWCNVGCASSVPKVPVAVLNIDFIYICTCAQVICLTLALITEVVCLLCSITVELGLMSHSTY